MPLTPKQSSIDLEKLMGSALAEFDEHTEEQNKILAENINQLAKDLAFETERQKNEAVEYEAKQAAVKMAFEALMQSLLDSGCALHYTAIEAWQKKFSEFEVQAQLSLNEDLGVDRAFRAFTTSFHKLYNIAFDFNSNIKEARAFLKILKNDISKIDTDKDSLNVWLANNSFDSRANETYINAGVGNLKKSNLLLVEESLEAVNLSIINQESIKEQFAKLISKMQAKAKFYHEGVLSFKSINLDIQQGFEIRKAWHEYLALEKSHALVTHMETYKRYFESLDSEFKNLTLKEKMTNLKALRNNFATNAEIIQKKKALIIQASDFRTKPMARFVEDISFIVGEVIVGVAHKDDVLSTNIASCISGIDGLLGVLQEVDSFITTNQAANNADKTLNTLFLKARSLVLNSAEPLDVKIKQLNEIHQEIMALENGFSMHQQNLPQVQKELKEKINIVSQKFPKLCLLPMAELDEPCCLDDKVVKKIFSRNLCGKIELLTELAKLAPKFSTQFSINADNSRNDAVAKKGLFDHFSLPGLGMRDPINYFIDNIQDKLSELWKNMIQTKGIYHVLYPLIKFVNARNDIRDHHKSSRQQFRLVTMAIGSLLGLYFFSHLGLLASIWAGAGLGALVGKYVFKVYARVWHRDAHYDRLTLREEVEQFFTPVLRKTLIKSINQCIQDNKKIIGNVESTIQDHDGAVANKKKLKKLTVALEKVETSPEAVEPAMKVLSFLYENASKKSHSPWVLATQQEMKMQKHTSVLAEVQDLTCIVDKVRPLPV